MDLLTVDMTVRVEGDAILVDLLYFIGEEGFSTISKVYRVSTLSMYKLMNIYSQMRAVNDLINSGASEETIEDAVMELEYSL
jgi:hypothetical protein